AGCNHSREVVRHPGLQLLVSLATLFRELGMDRITASPSCEPAAEHCGSYSCSGRDEDVEDREEHIAGVGRGVLDDRDGDAIQPHSLSEMVAVAGRTAACGEGGAPATPRERTRCYHRGRAVA